MKKDYTLIEATWKDKLVCQGVTHTTLEDIELSEDTRFILGKIGLPVIMPIEKKVSFLPFTFFNKTRVGEKEFYIIGDFSSGLSGITLLGVSIGNEYIYRITKDYEGKNCYYFVNQSLYQFLMFLAIFNIREEKISQRIDENYIATGAELRTEYKTMVNEMNQIDEKAILTGGAYWWHKLNDIRWTVEAREEEENTPYDENKKEFPQITGDDLPF